MKRVKIILPKGGTKAFSNNSQGLNGEFYSVSPHSVVYEAEEIIIEGYVTVNNAPVITGDFRIPFDLEAAKAGAKVFRNGAAGRWLGLSEHNENAKNIVEDEFGLWYVEDHELSMAPKAKKFLWLNIYPQGTNSGRDVGVHESEEKAKLAATSKCIGIAQRVEVDA